MEWAAAFCSLWSFGAQGTIDVSCDPDNCDCDQSEWFRARVVSPHRASPGRIVVRPLQPRYAQRSARQKTAQEDTLVYVLREKASAWSWLEQTSGDDDERRPAWEPFSPQVRRVPRRIWLAGTLRRGLKNEDLRNRSHRLRWKEAWQRRPSTEVGEFTRVPT